MKCFFLIAFLWSCLLAAFDWVEYPIVAAEIEEEEEEIGPSILLDLEKMVDNFVLETKKIEIPGFPEAFNPSIVRWQNRFLVSFRFYHPTTRSANQIGLVWMNDDFSVASIPEILDVRGMSSSYPSVQQDPRLVKVGDTLYLSFSNSIEGIDKDIRRMYLTELRCDEKGFFIEKPECITRYLGARDDRWEKNWVAFDYEGTFLYGYSIFPHLIFRPLFGRGECETVASTFSPIQWQWGVPRGGTPALPMDDGGDYLAFFHSSIYLPTVHSKGKKIQHYFMGAYTFSRTPPFSITGMSPKPIVGKDFYHGKEYKTWKNLRVVFPSGFVMDDEHVWIFYGRQDHELWVAKLKKQGLLNSLLPMNTQK